MNTKSSENKNTRANSEPELTRVFFLLDKASVTHGKGAVICTYYKLSGQIKLQFPASRPSMRMF